MNCIYETKYKIYEPQLGKNYNLAIISDLHFSYNVKDKKLTKIYQYLKNASLDYILFPGDIIDTLDMIQSVSEKKRLYHFLEKLGSIAPVIISIGNHEFYEKDKIKRHQKIYKYDEKFFKELKSLKNIYLLNNSSYEDKEFYIFGLTLTNAYYCREEQAEDLLNELVHIDSKYFKNLPINKQKLLLIHSPENLMNKRNYKNASSTKKQIYDKLIEYNYFISGHMHNGCVFPILNEIWNSSRGFISPIKKLFAKNTRKTLRTKEDKLLVNGPLTTFHEITGPLQLVNFIFPIHISIMEYKNNELSKAFTIENHYKF